VIVVWRFTGSRLLSRPPNDGRAAHDPHRRSSRRLERPSRQRSTAGARLPRRRASSCGPYGERSPSSCRGCWPQDLHTICILSTCPTPAWISRSQLL